jgi:hypothetical protein
MDLYSFADGDPLNNFDPDGRLFAGTLNGAGQWGSQMYAGLGNALDAALHAIVSPWNPLTATRNFSGGYEADFRYQRNFDQGTAAFQLGHQLGYAGAEIGFQMGMFAGPMAFGRMASTAASGGGMSAAIARSGGAMSYGITRAVPSAPIVSLQAPVMTGNTLAGPTKLPATTTASSGGTMNIPQPAAASRGVGALYPRNALLSPMNYEWGGNLQSSGSQASSTVASRKPVLLGEYMPRVRIAAEANGFRVWPARNWDSWKQAGVEGQKNVRWLKDQIRSDAHIYSLGKTMGHGRGDYYRKEVTELLSQGYRRRSAGTVNVPGFGEVKLYKWIKK